MKFKILVIVMVCVFCGCFNLNNAGLSAAVSSHNLCQDDVTVTWSGTWQVPGTEGTNNPGTNLIDGDYTNKWGSSDIRVSGEEWVQITFKKAVDIGGFYIWQESSGAYTNIAQYKIQIQNQSDVWVDAFTSEVFTELWTEESHELDTAVKATAFRFYCKSEQALAGTVSPAGQCAIELSEIEIYEKVAVANATNAGTAATGVIAATSTNLSTAKVSATQSKASPTIAKAATSSPIIENKDPKSPLVPIIIGAVVVVAGAAAAFIIIKKRKV